MKKYLFIAVLATASMMVYAQPRAIGGRMGTFCGVSYEHSLSEKNMVEMELGWGLGARLDGNYNGTGWWFSGNDIELAATYDWIDPFNAPVPWNEKGEWHWYMGVGGGAGMYQFSDPKWFAGVVGHIGIEYDFWFPLQLSVDWRPNIGVSNYYNNWFNLGGLYGGVSLGVRYKF